MKTSASGKTAHGRSDTATVGSRPFHQLAEPRCGPPQRGFAHKVPTPTTTINTQFQIPANDNIHLSALTPEDKPALVEYLNERDISERTLRIPYPYTEADADWFLDFDSQTTAEHGHPIHFAIRETSGSLIGVCGFEGLIHGHRAEIGYWLAKPYWGNGIMTEVVRAACEFAFSNWNLVRITAHVFQFTNASAKVLEKNGFELEGVLRKHHRKDGKFLDAKLFALVR